MQTPEQIKALLEGPFAPLVEATKAPLPLHLPADSTQPRKDLLLAAAKQAQRAATGAALLRWSLVVITRRTTTPTDFIGEMSAARIHVDDARDMERALQVAARVATMGGDYERRLMTLCQHMPDGIARLQLVCDSELAVLLDGGVVRGMSLDDIAEEVRNGY